MEPSGEKVLILCTVFEHLLQKHVRWVRLLAQVLGLSVRMLWAAPQGGATLEVWSLCSLPEAG